MSRAAVTCPSKEELRQMSAAQLDSYLGQLRHSLTYRSGPAHKSISKRLEVAEKIRALKGEAGSGSNDV